MGHVSDGRAQSRGVARHLEGHVEALNHAELGLDVVQVAREGIDGERRAHPPRELPAVGVRLGDHDEPRTRVTDDGRGHEADRPSAGNQHVLAKHGEGQGRVHGIPEGVEDRRDLLVDARPVVPDVRHR